MTIVPRAPDPVWDKRLSDEEFRRREAESVAAVAGPEGDEMRALHEWFVRRYPTPLDRLRYVRQQLASLLHPAKPPPR